MKKRPYIKLVTLAIVFITGSFFPTAPDAAEVLILGNSKLKPVADVIKSIKRTVPSGMTVISPEEAKDDLEGLVRKENATVVIALGKNAVVYALSIPESIPVIYGLIIDPIETKRKNITGVYMSTPITEYISFIKTNLPSIKVIGIICPHAKRKYLDRLAVILKIEILEAKDPYEFIDGLYAFSSDVDALLLLPERDLITSKALEKLYLFSFKEKVPVIGISEKYVKIGSLFSLGFDIEEMGRQIGEITNRVLSEGSASNISPTSPDKLNLYINTRTSKTMRLKMPAEVLETAKKVYQ